MLLQLHKAAAFTTPTPGQAADLPVSCTYNTRVCFLHYTPQCVSVHTLTRSSSSSMPVVTVVMYLIFQQRDQTVVRRWRHDRGSSS